METQHFRERQVGGVVGTREGKTLSKGSLKRFSLGDGQPLARLVQLESGPTCEGGVGDETRMVA